MKNLKFYLIVLLLTSCASLYDVRKPASSGNSRTAYDVFGELREASVNFSSKALMVDGAEGQITWGAEKEASSSILTRIMGPKGDDFKRLVMNMNEDKRKDFLSDFFSNWVKNSNGYRTYKDEQGKVWDLAKDVKSLDGQAKTIELAPFQNIDYSTASLDVLDEKFNLFIEKSHGNPLNFIKPTTRRKIFIGKLPGLEDRFLKGINYTSWIPMYGKAEAYIDAAHRHGGGQFGGWEINFKPQKTYGEFQESILWFRQVLNKNGRLFEAPGHQRILFPVSSKLKPKKLSEIYKMLQALIVIEGINGGTGIEVGAYKDIISDQGLMDLSNDGRGPIRPDSAYRSNQWGQSFLDLPNQEFKSLEFRAGTKDLRVAHYTQSVLAARIAANYYDDLHNADSYTLVELLPNNLSEKLIERFGLTTTQAEQAYSKISSLDFNKNYLVPLWSWENVPFLSKGKKALLKELTKSWLIQIGESQNSMEVRELMRGWSKASNLARDISEYVYPNQNIPARKQIHNFRPSGRMAAGAGFLDGEVNVNKIDLGIEYSAKFPVRIEADYDQTFVKTFESGRAARVWKRLPDGKMSWIRTRSDMTASERDAFLKKIAEDLSENLGSRKDAVKLDIDGHGHGLDISYEITDPQNRKWRVEWDGIGRTYKKSGEIVNKSTRAGSIEVVTPKFQPKMKEIQAVFKTFYSNNALPYIKQGGGHINLDLAAFAGKPKEFARFLSIFHEHRSIIAYLFQDINRTQNAEPVTLSDNIIRQLKNFGGTEEELKKLLYNEKYFNQRVGRKTRYTHLDVSAYYQDVIPKEFISADYDISNPQVKWRPQFRVEPNIRKAEFRLFNAPKDAYESSIQIKLVRSMLHKALNNTDELSGVVQNISHEEFTKNPKLAFTKLDEMAADLGIKSNEYKVILGEALYNTNRTLKSPFYKTLPEKLAINKIFRPWGSAVSAREESLSSEARAWTGEDSREANEFQELRKISVDTNKATRASSLPSIGFKRDMSCSSAVASILAR